MGEIVLKIPSRKKRLQLIQSEKILNDIILERQHSLRSKLGYTVLEKKSKEADLLAEALHENNQNDEIGFGIENIEQEEIRLSTHFLDEINILEKNAEELVSNSSDIAIENELSKEPDIYFEDKYVERAKPVFTEIYTVSDGEGEPVQISHNDSARNKIDVEVAEKYVQDAYDKGYEDAHEIANLNVQDKILDSERYIRRIDRLMDALRQHYQIQINQFHNKLIELSIIVAESVINREVEQDNNIVINQIEKVFKELGDDTVFKIIINPDDLEILKQAQTILASNNKSITSAELIADGKIEQGGCILHTSAGSIDATIISQLNKIKIELEQISKEEKLENPYPKDSVPEIPEIGE